MKKFTFSCLFLLATICVFAQNVWALDPGHSKVGFTASHHMISEVDGYSKKY